MKKFVLIGILMFTVDVLMAQYDPKALEVLEAMSKKYKTMTAFEANLSHSLINETEGVKEESKAKITVKGEKFVLSLGDQEIFNNGTTVWTYLPSAKEVSIDNYDPSSDDINPIKVFEIYKKGFKYLHLGEKTEAGIAVEEIDLVPEKKNAQYFKIKMFISKKDKSIQSWTMFDRSGNKYKYTIIKFVPNIKVEDSFFNFDLKKHPGIEVNELR
jgi:outer membrane lipoprotein-sorting protein